MKGASELEILGGEGQQIGVFRGFGNAAEGFVEIVVVVNENSPRAVCQSSEEAVLSRSSRDLNQTLTRRRSMFASDIAGRMVAGISKRHDDIQAASVQCVNDDLRADCAINDLVIFVLHPRSHTTYGDKSYTALPGHPGYSLNHPLQ